MNANTKNSQMKHCPCPKHCDKAFLKKVCHNILDMGNVLLESF